MIYGRYSIGCWLDPNSSAPCDGEEYFDDVTKMDAAVVRLLSGGRYKSIVTYEWSDLLQDYEEVETYHEADIEDLRSSAGS
jgi:hypothetical protein